MDFWKDLGRLHVFAKEIPCLTDQGAPTQRTEGAPGVLYMDTDTGALYKCRGGEKGACRWESLLNEEDKAELVSAVIEALGGSPVFGILDENNSIIISGLADGSYTVKYEMADGSTLDIGPLVLDGETENYFDTSAALLNYRLNSAGSPTAQNGMVTTDFIPLEGIPEGAVFYYSGAPLVASTAYSYFRRIVWYDESQAKIAEDNATGAPASESSALAPVQPSSVTASYARITMVIKDTEALTEADIADLKITVG